MSRLPFWSRRGGKNRGNNAKNDKRVDKDNRVDDRDRVEDEDDRVKFNIEYNNYTQEQGLVKFIFNSFIREEDQEEERDLIKKIVINPVMPIVEKKRRYR